LNVAAMQESGAFGVAGENQQKRQCLCGLDAGFAHSKNGSFRGANSIVLDRHGGDFPVIKDCSCHHAGHGAELIRN